MKPRALDLFCGAGGATKGLQRAGFYVVGVDMKSQPRYCGDEFHLADAMTFPLDGYDFIWASPPCQRYSRATAWRGDRRNHPDLIDAVRLRLLGHLYVIENVEDARKLLWRPFMLCGTMFSLPVKSHRYFETPLEIPLVPPCCHKNGMMIRDHGGRQTESQFRDAMGCEWMRAHDAREAIPPAYAEFIGWRAMEHIVRVLKPA